MLMHKPWPPNNVLANYIMEQFPADYVGWGIDIGASDGISINTTFALEVFHRWTILSVEANPGFSQMLHQRRAFVEMCACSDSEGEAIFHVNDQNPEALSSLEPTDRPKLLEREAPKSTWSRVKVATKTVDQLLDKWEFPQLDVLCIDTEGTELSVVVPSSLVMRKPLVICVECWDATGPMDPYLAKFGYEKTARNTDNNLYIRRNA